jgi:hypothetical protein
VVEPRKPSAGLVFVSGAGWRSADPHKTQRTVAATGYSTERLKLGRAMRSWLRFVGGKTLLLSFSDFIDQQNCSCVVTY